MTIIRNSKKNHVCRFGRRVFTKRAAEILKLKPLEAFKGLRVPLMILYGKKDKLTSPGRLQNIEKLLDEQNFRPRRVMCFRGLDQFLGELVKEKNTIKRYKAHKEVLEMIREWLKTKCLDNLTNA